MPLNSREKRELEKQFRRLNSKVCLLKEEDTDIQAELDLKADLVGGVVPTDQLPITQDIIDALNNANAPDGTNYFTTLADLSSITPGTLINVANNYSALPAANTVSGEFYWVENAQGTSWLPGPLGGTYYPNGLYYSNGTTWIFTDMPFNATQVEVDAGLNNNKFVTPLTLNNASKWSTKQDTLSLTTTGTSGAATLVGATLNIPQYQGVLTNPVTGTGTAGQVSYWSGTTTQTGSNNLFWDAANGRMGIGTTTPTVHFEVAGDIRFSGHSLLDISLPSRHTITAGFKAYWPGANSSFMASTVTGFEGWTLNTNIVRSIGGWQLQDTSKSGWSMGALYGSSSDSFFIQRSASTSGNANFIDFFRIFSNGNIAINSSTNAGQKFQVYGSTLLRGSGTTSATTALLVQNSTPSALFNIADNGFIDIGNAGTGAAPRIFPFSSSFGSIDLSGRNLQFISYVNTQSTANGSFSFAGINFAQTSGTNIFFLVSNTFAPTSGTGTFNAFNIQTTINQTGGANGITRGLYVNPTLTSAADWRSIEFSNNTGRGIWGVGTADNAVAGNLNVGSATVANSSAVLEVTSTTKGFLPPRMTEAQKNAISTPATGLLIYQTDATAGFYFYNGAAWKALAIIA